MICWEYLNIKYEDDIGGIAGLFGQLLGNSFQGGEE